MNENVKRPDRLFGVVMAWTVFTTVFAWLPIMRALARPEAYYWGLFGLRGEGLDGPFFIFPILAVYSLVLFAYAWYPRPAFRVLLVLWHVGWGAAFIIGWFVGGGEGRWQGQGWGWNFPVLLPALLYGAFAAVATWWAIKDAKGGRSSPDPRWTRGNNRRLVLAVALLPVGFLLFRAGTNYNWVTALAIGVTILQWITVSEALQPRHE